MVLPAGAIKLAVLSFVFAALAITALAFRLWSRHMMRNRLQFNDYAAMMAMIFAAGDTSVFLIAAFAGGLGKHMKDVPMDELAIHLKLFVPAQLLWGAANTCVKISIVHLYIRIFPGRLFSKFCYGVIILTSCYFLSVLLEAFVLCKPVSYNWDKTIPGGKCANENLAFLLAGITNLLIDAIVVILPIPMLWRLQMPLIRKLGVLGMFGLGAIICIVSLQRVLWLSDFDLTNLTYSATEGAYWSVLEPTLGIVNACLPVMRPALKKLFHKDMFNWSKVYGTQQATADRQWFHGQTKSSRDKDDLDKNRFRRLDDPEYLLTDVAIGQKSSPSSSDVIRVSTAEAAQDNFDKPFPGNSIKVTRSWNVHSATGNGDQA